jgi:hypothetical protein
MSEAFGKVGHWAFRLERHASSQFELWELNCQLCRYKTCHRVLNGAGYRLLLTTGVLKDCLSTLFFKYSHVYFTAWRIFLSGTLLPGGQPFAT